MNFLSKLNLESQKEILVLNAPEELDPLFTDLPGIAVRRSVDDIKQIDWALAFVKKEYEVERTMRTMIGKIVGDITLWFAYPKQSSKRYESEINSELGWKALGKAGYDGVRGVALDEDWSALRFRKNTYINKMTKNEAWILSREGRRRAGDRNPPEDDF